MTAACLILAAIGAFVLAFAVVAGLGVMVVDRMHLGADALGALPIVAVVAAGAGLITAVLVVLSP